MNSGVRLPKSPGRPPGPLHELAGPNTGAAAGCPQTQAPSWERHGNRQRSPRLLVAGICSPVGALTWVNVTMTRWRRYGCFPGGQVVADGDSRHPDTQVTKSI